MKWISTKDQLPPKNVDVLVQFKHKPKDRKLAFENTDVTALVRDKCGAEWFDTHFGYRFSADTATHWAYLPEAPDNAPQSEDKLLPHEISATVAKNIKRLRTERSLTIAKLAEKVGCTEVTMSRYEKDQRIPNVVMLYNLAQCFGVSVDEFYRR